MVPDAQSFRYPVVVDEASLSSPDDLHLQLEGFEGPLDLLLTLARRQQVDLARISVQDLVEQSLAVMAERQRTDLSRAAEWLVMAAWLVWLKSRLLLPKSMEEARQGEQAGRVLADRLAELDHVRSVAVWLEARPQLGRDMFERGHGQSPAGLVVAADLVNLFQACADVLERPDQRTPEVYRPPRPALWTPIQALARMRAMLTGRAEGGDLLSFLPPVASDLPDRVLRLRSAVASSLAAALELARSGEADLRQDAPFGEVRIHPVVGSGPEPQPEPQSET